MSSEKYMGMDVHQATISVATWAAWLYDRVPDATFDPTGQLWKTGRST